MNADGTAVLKEQIRQFEKEVRYLKEINKKVQSAEKAKHDQKNTLTAAEAYHNPLFRLEEISELRSLVTKLRRECKEHKEKLRTTKRDHQNEISSIKEKLQLLQLENKTIIDEVEAKGDKSLKIDEQKLKKTFILEQEIQELREQCVLKEIAICALREQIKDSREREMTLLNDNIKINKHLKQLETEVTTLKEELALSNAMLDEHKRKSLKDRRDTCISREPSNKTSFTSYELLLQRREYEDEIASYKNEVKKLSSQFKISQHREKEQQKELETFKKLLFEAKRSEADLSNQHKQEKMFLDEKQKQFDELEVTSQVTKSKLARCEKDLGQQVAESEKLKSTQEEMKGYIDKLVAAVAKYNPKILEEVTL